MKNYSKAIITIAKNSEEFDEFAEIAEPLVRQQLEVYTDKQVYSELTHIWDEYITNNLPF